LASGLDEQFINTCLEAGLAELVQAAEIYNFVFVILLIYADIAILAVCQILMLGD